MGDESVKRTVDFGRRTFISGAGALAGLGLIGSDQAAHATTVRISTGPWGGYANGQIPLSALDPVIYPGVAPDAFPGSLPLVYLQPSAADALLNMLQDYHYQTSDYLQVDEGYRTVEGQTYWWNFWGHDPAMAAPPGTSNHGWGQAFDFEPNSLNSQRLNWARSNCAQYGYSPIGSEAWHFNYTGTDTSTQQEDEDEVKIVFVNQPDQRSYYAISALNMHYIDTSILQDAEIAIWGAPHVITADQRDRELVMVNRRRTQNGLAAIARL